MRHRRSTASDAELLASSDPQDFALFYRRHLQRVVSYSARRLGDSDLVADLVAEVFASALEARHSFDARRGDAPGWLCSIAANKIIDSARRGRIEDACRRRLGMEPLQLEAADLIRVEEMAAAAALVGDAEARIDGLPAPTAAAVHARVLDEDEYEDIARDLQCSESVVRQRVSRGLRQLKNALGGEA